MRIENVPQQRYSTTYLISNILGKFLCVLIDITVQFRSNVLQLSERGLGSQTSANHAVPVLEAELNCLRPDRTFLSLRQSFFCCLKPNLLRWRFLPAPVGDYSSHGRPMLQVLEDQIATMKGAAVWYQQAKVCQSGYAHTEHLSTCVAVMACQHGACCVLAATPNTMPQQCGVACEKQ